ncbi:MAG TPA: ABC transporter ATP-binding protein [Acidisphaera sp.]|nr:ABC transporter ATP-binding protein [Acidisphaera sp.]
MTDPVLRIRGLHVGFPTDTGIVRAVDGVDLDVLAGECLGVVGESGSGKTVTFLATLGLVAPPGVVTAETISWKGRDLLKLRAAEMRAVRGREIALTMQDALTALNPVLSIGTQIDETLAAHGAYRSSTDRRARAVELLQLVGIPEPARRLRAYPYELSGGMRQRAMIAVALACGPDLLIADEPTTALDVTVQAQVLELLGDLRARLGMSLVLVTHNLAIVAEHCDRVAVMYAGQVVETGPAVRVVSAPRHPYTAGLVASIPTVDRLDAEIVPIPGRIPDPRAWPTGCRFADRCGYRADDCATPQPMRPATDGGVRCCLADAA